ncbi:HNH endonuclease signature motif containing protein [Enterobacteriaceae bacterium ESL0689]|nr:HNH endonuclease signature motif containing protein [Enterobacteriaceae bacterium ESL0689]
MRQFKSLNQMEIREGNAPFSIVPEQVGGRKRFEIHHIKRIIDGGAVYDFENMRIYTVRNHISLHSKKDR